MIDVDGRLMIPARELSLSFARSSGPGGQNVNKVNSKVILTWSPVTSAALPDAVRQRFLAKFASRLTKEGQIVVTSQRSRDQRTNVEDCHEKLQAMLRGVLDPPKRRRKTLPTRASKERRLTAKKHRSAAKARRKVAE